MSFQIMDVPPEGEVRYYLTTAKITQKDGRTNKLYTLLYDNVLDSKDREIICDHIAQSFLSENAFRCQYFENKWYILRAKEEGDKLNSANLFLAENQVEFTKTKLSSSRERDTETGPDGF